MSTPYYGVHVPFLLNAVVKMGLGQGQEYDSHVQVKKLRLRDIKSAAQAHKASPGTVKTGASSLTPEQCHFKLL